VDYQEQGFISPIDVMPEDEAASCLDELIHHPMIVDAVEDIFLAQISPCGAAYFFIKDPNSKGYVNWYQDCIYMGLKPAEFCTPWLALTPGNLSNDCMSMIPGTHKQHIIDHVDTFADDNRLTRGQVIPDVDESKASDLILKAGQMSIHHAEIIYGSRSNHSQQRRVGYAMQAFMWPQVQQIIGDNYWLSIRGKNARSNSIDLHRPHFYLDPVSYDECQ
jgi:non-heme Fe2+,alpha-ketoglutarate-dependent halogenase